MCIAILNAGKRIQKDKLSNCWDNNDDGAGILYVADGVLVSEKFPNELPIDSKKNFEEFYARYVDINNKYGDLPMLLHFRIATHGLTPEYLHPFFVSESVGFVHNGIIDGLGTKDKSDTSDFADLLSNIIIPSVATLDNPFIEESIYRFIEDSSKLIFLDNTGEYRIFNETIGQWVGENWFSNTSHTNKPIKYDYGYKLGNKYNDPYGSIYDADEVDDWNKGFSKTKGTMYPYSNSNNYDKYGIEDYDYDARFINDTYFCAECLDDTAEVNYESECLTCWSYIPEAASAVIQKMDDLSNPKPLNKATNWLDAYDKLTN
jgi:hypothetical protein